MMLSFQHHAKYDALQSPTDCDNIFTRYNCLGIFVNVIKCNLSIEFHYNYINA